MPKSWKEHATRDELETYWTGELKKAVAADCKAVCSCADVRIPFENGELAPCILIHLETAQPSAEDIGYPYTRNGSTEVKMGVPTSVKTDARIFNGNGA